MVSKSELSQYKNGSDRLSLFSWVAVSLLWSSSASSSSDAVHLIELESINSRSALLDLTISVPKIASADIMNEGCDMAKSMRKTRRREVELKFGWRGHGQSFFQQHPLRMQASLLSHIQTTLPNGFQNACQKFTKQHWATKTDQDMPTCENLLCIISTPN